MQCFSTGTTVSSADSALFARQMCLGFLQQRLSKMTKLDQEMLDALRVYDSRLPREPQWGDDFFGISPFYIPIGTHCPPNAIILSSHLVSTPAQHLCFYKALEIRQETIIIQLFDLN